MDWFLLFASILLITIGAIGFVKVRHCSRLDYVVTVVAMVFGCLAAIVAVIA